MASSTPRPTPASVDSRSLRIPILLWRTLLRDLRTKAEGVRESGAFLLGEQRGREDRVRSYVLYHDLDPHVSNSGIIRFSSEGYPPLWRACRERKQRAIADVHCHPDNWVGQSQADRDHPMIPERGHVSLIVPCFADVRWWSLKTVGVYEYAGGRTWSSFTRPGRAVLTLL